MLSSNAGFWETLDLIIGREAKSGNKEELVQEWLNKLINRRKLRNIVSEESVCGGFAKIKTGGASQKTEKSQHLQMVDEKIPEILQ